MGYGEASSLVMRGYVPASILGAPTQLEVEIARAWRRPTRQQEHSSFHAEGLGLRILGGMGRESLRPRRAAACWGRHGKPEVTLDCLSSAPASFSFCSPRSRRRSSGGKVSGWRLLPPYNLPPKVGHMVGSGGPRPGLGTHEVKERRIPTFHILY